MSGQPTAIAASPLEAVQRVNPDHLYDTRIHGYSTGAIAPAGVRIAYISGQGGADAKGGYSPDFNQQVTQAYENLGAVLDAMGASPERVIKLTTYVVDHDPSKLEVLTGSVKAMFGSSLPAQTLVPVSSLAIPPMLFEVEAIVALP